MNYLKLGRAIRQKRQANDLTQENLAMKAEISASFLGHIERGSRKASLETLLKIVNALECGFDLLFAEQLIAIRNAGAEEVPEMQDVLNKITQILIEAHRDRIL